MPLTGEEIAARARNAAITVDDGYDIPGGELHDWPAGHEVLLTRITNTLAAYPHLTNDLGYSWTADRTAYRTLMDVIFQHHVLELLADVDPGHPNLAASKPVAARQAINRDFISYAQPARDVDFIFVGRGFMDVLKYFLEMTVDIMDLVPEPQRRLPWGPSNLEEIREHRQQDVAGIVSRFVDQAIRVTRGTAPAPHGPITQRLATQPNHMWMTYDAVESFIVAHEFAHLLERHDVRDDTPGKEIHADQAAVSLQLARGGTQKAVDGTSAMAAMAVSVGGPAFYLLGSLFYLISALGDWTRNQPIDSHMKTIASLKVRWLYYRKYLTDLGLPTEMRITEHVVGVHRMVSLCIEAISAYSMMFNLRARGKPLSFLDERILQAVWGDWLDDDTTFAALRPKGQ